jgi:hypothetical protein
LDRFFGWRSLESWRERTVCQEGDNDDAGSDTDSDKKSFA